MCVFFVVSDRFNRTVLRNDRGLSKASSLSSPVYFSPHRVKSRLQTVYESIMCLLGFISDAKAELSWT